MKNSNQTISPYTKKHTCFYFEAKKKVAKYVTSGTSCFTTGNFVVAFSKNDAEKIKKNAAGTKSNKYKEFEITDKQFGLINFTSIPYHADLSVLSPLRKCKMPHLLINENGKAVMIPVTNLQFMGCDNLNRKNFWI